VSNNWVIDSISLAQAYPAISSTKEEMEKLAPDLPRSRWKEFSRSAGENGMLVRIGHINPEINADPRLMMSPGSLISQSGNATTITAGVSTKRGRGWKDYFEMATALAESGLAPDVTLEKVQKQREQVKAAYGSENFDVTGDITIGRCPDEKIAKEELETMRRTPTQGFDVPVPGMPGNVSVMDILKSDLVKAQGMPEEVIAQIEAASERMKKEGAISGVKYEKGEFLGHDAIFGEKNNVKLCLAVRVKNFIVSGMLLFMMDAFPPGNTPCDSLTKSTTKTTVERIGGQIFTTHEICPVQSTIAKEGYAYKEEVEGIFRSVFSKIEKAKEGTPRETGLNAEVTRGKTKIESPKEGFEVKKGDIIKTDGRTQVNIVGGVGKVSIGGGGIDSIVKINDSSIELSVGNVAVFLKKPKTKFEVRTPISTASVCGATFALHVDKNITSLTVVDGDGEFSDLKGNRATVKSNQTCVCFKDRGLQKPATLPFNLKEQFGRA